MAAPTPAPTAGTDAGTDGGSDGGVVATCGNGVVEGDEQCDDGNLVADDGCEQDCTLTVAEEVQCATLAPLASGTCQVTAGGAAELLEGDVLTPGRIYRGGQVAVDATGTIACVGCNCADAVPGATVITCPHGAISPGLINPHDHLTYTQNPPFTDTGERYEQRHDWRKGERGHTKIPAPGGATADQKDWGELRQLMGGTTSLVGAGSGKGLVRNLDSSSGEEGLGQPAVDLSVFPLDDSNGLQRFYSCNYGSKADTEQDIASANAYIPHVAEGIDQAAHNEFLCVSSADEDTAAPGLSHDLTQPKSAFIHAVALDPADYARMAHDGTGLVWSPRSNICLYGNTAEVTVASRAGVDIALGTDWTPTGSINVVRELACADQFNQTYLGGYFGDQALWRMVTVNAARLSGDADVLGTLAPGKIGDIAVFDEAAGDAYRAVIAAEPQDVALVLRAGTALYGEAPVVGALASGCDTLDVCGASKQVCLQSEIGKSLSALQSAVGSTYGAFFCGTPTGEPTCVPSRPAAVNGSTTYDGAVSSADTDGDGIPDATDDCPTVFNPIRPMDDGQQADWDGDGVGDACDPCPMGDDANCPAFDPSDTDGDGVADSADNCPAVANPDQADSDSDGRGDACDECPDAANPDAAGCPATIYDIRNLTVPLGSNVAVAHALVTARTASGYFIQVKETDPGYAGPDYSGVYVYDPSNTVTTGERVTITSAVNDLYFGEMELKSPVTTVDSTTPEAPPAPTVVSPADVATGGSRADALDGVLVQVQDVTVTDVAPTPGPGDQAPTNEFAVDAGLRVDDLFYLTTPFPVVGENFGSISGVLTLRNENTKIEPRDATDLVPGQPSIADLSPTPTYTRVGDTGVATFPVPLTVTLARAPSADTFVAITSTDTASLTVAGGGVTVPAGQVSAPVLVNGLAQAADVTLNASLGSSTATAHVRVLGAAEQPTTVTLTPDPAAVAPGGTLTFTVTLDLPAPAGGTDVGLAVAPAAAGALPATVTVPANATQATFDYVDQNGGADATVTATLGSSTSSVTVTQQTGPDHLVINEVDYNQAGTDTASFVEIYNGTGAPVDLTNLAVVLVNGSSTQHVEYQRYALSDAGASLAAGQYLVIGNASVVSALPGGALSIDVGTSNFIQNGDPDGLAIIDTSTQTLVDAFCYGGPMTAETINGFPAPVSLVEGTALDASVVDTNTDASALIRDPNGTDTDDANADWKFTSTPTPGADNLLTP